MGDPIAGEDFTIKFENGEVKNGNLDENGFARFDRVLSGTFKIQFPNLNMEDLSQ